MRRNFHLGYVCLALLAGWGCGNPPKIPTSVLSNLPVVAAGLGTTCILDPTGKVVCFGMSVGDTSFSAHLAPFTLTSLGTIKSVALSSGTNTGCVVKADAMLSVVCWGYQGIDLGTSTQLPPTAFPVPGVQGAVAVSAGKMAACAILGDGRVECWNFNDQSNTAINVAIQPGLAGIAQISVGNEHACAIQTDHSVLCWGKNERGQLGNGQIAPSTVPTFPPTVVPGLKAVSVSAGAFHTCAVLVDGSVQCWGFNSDGELGMVVQPSNQVFPSPQPVAGLSNALAVSVGDYFSCVALSDRTAKCWGINDKGQLGTGSTAPRSATPSTVQGLQRIVFISAGSQHACGSGFGVTIECWGADGSGQLTDGMTNDSNTPKP
jgi:alpha-tubulin suppressor-like RCC1 family protein